MDQLSSNPSLVRMLLLGLLLLLAAQSSSGCAVSPQVKRAAQTLTPSPPSTAGSPVEKGRVRLYGGMGPALSDVYESPVSSLGDAGLYVPQYQFLGGLRVGLHRNLELGLKGVYATYDSTEPSTVGVPPLGPNEQDVVGAGPTLALNFPLGQSGRVFAGAIVEALWTSIPYSIWQCRTCTEPLPYRDHIELYSLVEEGRENYLMWNNALQLGLYLDPAPVTVFGGVGMHSTVRNIGFDEHQDYSSTLEKGSPVGLFFLGIEIAPVERLNVQLQGYLPVGQDLDEGQVFGPGFTFNVGLTL